MKNQTTFTPSASVNFNIVAGGATAFTLPAVDPSNPDTLIQNNGSDSVYLSFGYGAVAGPNVTGGLRVDSGHSLLLTNTSLPPSGSIVAGNQAIAAATSISVTAMSGTNGHPVTISRGTASASPAF